MLFSLVALAPILAEEEREQEQELKATSTIELKDRAKDAEEGANDIKTRQLMSSLEKILTPEQIKNFTNIVRQGNSLYGVRKMATSSATFETSASTTITNRSNEAIKKLEKISAPWLINQYEQIKKVGTALWGLKKEKIEEGRENKLDASSSKVYVSGSESTCVINAIKAKDTVLQANNTSTVAAVNAAIATRTVCQEQAIVTTAVTASSTLSTTEMAINQKKELNVCVKAFKESAAKIKKEAATQHKNTWEAYRTSLKACKASSSAAIIIEDGGGNILDGLVD